MHTHIYMQAHTHLYSFLSSLPSLFYDLAFHSQSCNSAQSNCNLTVLHMYVLFYTTISFGYLPAHLIQPIQMPLFLNSHFIPVLANSEATSRGCNEYAIAFTVWYHSENIFYAIAFTVYINLKIYYTP